MNRTHGHVTSVESLSATPPRIIAKATSNRVMNGAFFPPNSFARANIVATQGMQNIATKVKMTI